MFGDSLESPTIIADLVDSGASNCDSLSFILDLFANDQICHSGTTVIVINSLSQNSTVSVPIKPDSDVYNMARTGVNPPHLPLILLPLPPPDNSPWDGFLESERPMKLVNSGAGFPHLARCP